jgi:hypothetical protein
MQVRKSVFVRGTARYDIVDVLYKNGGVREYVSRALIKTILAAKYSGNAVELAITREAGNRLDGTIGNERDYSVQSTMTRSADGLGVKLNAVGVGVAREICGEA